MYKSEDTASQTQMSKINAQDEVRSTQKQKMETERALGFGVPCMQAVYSVSSVKVVPGSVKRFLGDFESIN